MVVSRRRCVFDGFHRCTVQPSRSFGGRVSGGSDDWATLGCTLCFYMVPSHPRQHATERRSLWPLADVCPSGCQVVCRHLSRRVRSVLRSSLAIVHFVSGSVVHEARFGHHQPFNGDARKQPLDAALDPERPPRSTLSKPSCRTPSSTSYSVCSALAHGVDRATTTLGLEAPNLVRQQHEHSYLAVARASVSP